MQIPKYIYRKYWKEAAERGYILSVKQLKSFDRIVIPVQKVTGLDSIEVLSEEQKKSFGDITKYPFEMALPFIPEAVVNVPHINGTSLWIYYHADYSEIEEKKLNLSVEYSIFVDGAYWFYAKFEAIVIFSDFANNEITIMVKTIIPSYGFLKLIPFEELGFSKSEMEVFEMCLKNDQQYFLETFHKRIDKSAKTFEEKEELIIREFNVDTVKALLKIFTAVNIILQEEKDAKEDEKNSTDTAKPNSSKSSPAKPSTQDTISAKRPKGTKTINIGGISIVRAKQDSKVKIRKGRVINRVTDVWGVRGHVRHYRSGKTVYIKPYEKGPGRKKTGKKQGRQKKIYRMAQPGKEET